MTTISASESTPAPVSRDTEAISTESNIFREYLRVTERSPPTPVSQPAPTSFSQGVDAASAESTIFLESLPMFQAKVQRYAHTGMHWTRCRDPYCPVHYHHLQTHGAYIYRTVCFWCNMHGHTNLDCHLKKSESAALDKDLRAGFEALRRSAGNCRQRSQPIEPSLAPDVFGQRLNLRQASDCWGR